jgi:trehalose 6-phosphate phosphatase
MTRSISPVQVPAPRAPIALFLDIDGTLVAHAARPDDVRIKPEVVELIGRLESLLDGALALISGRPLEAVDALFEPLQIPAAGQHGAERRDARGVLHLHPTRATRLARALPALRRQVARCAGLLLEEKGASVALHFRSARSLAGDAERIMQAVLLRVGEDFALQPGKCVIELKPSGVDKGTAIAAFLAEPPFAGRVPVFAGDDLTDEFGFGLVNRRGGVSIKVGTGLTAAQYRVANAGSVRAWLARLLRQLDAGAGAA